MKFQVRMGLSAVSLSVITSVTGWAWTTVFWYQSTSAVSEVMTPRLSVIFPCLMRVGRRCTNVFWPPSGYSSTSTCDEKPVTWVK